MTRQSVRVGVIGAGRWAVAHHIPGILAHPCGDLVAVAEPSSERRAELASRFGVAAFETADQLLALEMDAVVIASPPAAHYGAARAALESGLDVLIEKPMTVAPADAWDLVEVADRTRRHLVVGFTYQFTRLAQRAVELIESGAIGEIELIEASFASAMRHLYTKDGPGIGHAPLDRPAAGTFNDPALAGGGQASNQATHVVASMLGASGLSVASVSALTRRRGLELDLIDAALLEFTGDALGVLASTGDLQPLQRPHSTLRLYGTEGVLTHDLGLGTLSVDGGASVRESDLLPEELYPAQAPVRCFLDLILGVSPNPAPGVLGAKTVEVIDALYRSSASGGSRAVIQPQA